MKKLSFLILLFVLIVFACNRQTQKPSPSPNQPILDKSSITKPKNIIFMIGDGMGVTQISAGLYSNGNKLELERFKVMGLHKPYASNDLITDSAAGATAFASGIKTYNGAIGVDPDTIAHETLLEKAEKNGMATGLISTSTIVHATPASFIAHVKYRKQYEEIASWFLKTEIDLFIGGGQKYFSNREKDERNLYQELLDKDYKVSDYFKEDFNDFSFDTEKNIAYFTANDDPLPVLRGRDYLPSASKGAIDFLSERSQQGFFIMIEGSQIDWGGHANNTAYIISEMKDFDKAVGHALDFAEKDGETLVIITADHETGGFAINKGSTMDSIVGKFTSDYHTGDLIPVFAYGPGATSFGGIYENTAIFDKICALKSW